MGTDLHREGKLDHSAGKRAQNGHDGNGQRGASGMIVEPRDRRTLGPLDRQDERERHHCQRHADCGRPKQQSPLTVEADLGQRPPDGSGDSDKTGDIGRSPPRPAWRMTERGSQERGGRWAR